MAENTILNTNSSSGDFERADTQTLAKTNSRQKMKTNSNKSLSESDFNLTKTNVGGKSGTFVDFNLTKTAKKLTTGKTLKK